MGLERRLGRQGSFHVSRRVQTISTFLAYLMMGTPGVSFAEEAAAPIQGEAVPSGNQGEEEEQGKDQGQKKEGGASGYTPQDLEGIEVKLYRKPEKLPGDYSLEIEQVVQGKRNPWGMEAGVRVLSVAGYSGQLIIPEAAGTLHLDDLDPAYFRLSAGKVFHHGARRNAEVAHPVELLGYQDNGSFGTETFERFSYSQLDLNFGRPEALRFTAGGGGIFDLTGSLQATVEAMVGAYIADTTNNPREEYQLTSRQGNKVQVDRRKGEALPSQREGTSLVPTYGLSAGLRAFDWLCVSGGVDVIHAGKGTRNTVAAYGGFAGMCHRF